MNKNNNNSNISKGGAIMCNNISLYEAMVIAKKIKMAGGLETLYVELSGSLQDHINKTIYESNELIKKLDIS